MEGEEKVTSLAERGAFMQLPIEERRGLLAAQAETLEWHYNQDRECRELQAGDLVEQ